MMKTEKAITILKDEVNHCRQHLQFEGKADAYYEEMGDLVSALEMAIEALGNQPVVHGHWIDDDYRGKCSCSVCGTDYNWLENEFLTGAKFCPYCGARMVEDG